MANSELSISVGEIIGIPRVTLRGAMSEWHDQVISAVLGGFRDQRNTSLVLDIAGLTFAGAEGLAAMARALRSVGPCMCVHIVAQAATGATLHLAELGPSVRLYSSTDEIAHYLSPIDELLTSRWLAAGPQDEELPIAA